MNSTLLIMIGIGLVSIWATIKMNDAMKDHRTFVAPYMDNGEVYRYLAGAAGAILLLSLTLNHL